MTLTTLTRVRNQDDKCNEILSTILLRPTQARQRIRNKWCEFTRLCLFGREPNSNSWWVNRPLHSRRHLGGIHIWSSHWEVGRKESADIWLSSARWLTGWVNFLHLLDGTQQICNLKFTRPVNGILKSTFVKVTMGWGSKFRNMCIHDVCTLPLSAGKWRMNF